MVLLTRHWQSLLGVALVVTAVILWFFVLPVPIRGHVDNPYVGIVAFLLLPLVFFTGLTLVPIGIHLRKRHSRKDPSIAHVRFGALPAIYNRNVFPDLKVTWSTYPNNLGHTDFPGCFRCHDGSHLTADGKVFTQDCNTCHEPLAIDEVSPEILKTLGIAERISRVQKQ